jgi:hypothetical protein
MSGTVEQDPTIDPLDVSSFRPVFLAVNARFVPTGKPNFRFRTALDR